MIASFLSLLGIAASSWPFSFSVGSGDMTFGVLGSGNWTLGVFGSGDMTFGVLPLLFLPLSFLPCLGTAPSCFSRSARRGAFAFASISCLSSPAWARRPAAFPALQEEELSPSPPSLVFLALLGHGAQLLFPLCKKRSFRLRLHPLSF